MGNSTKIIIGLGAALVVGGIIYYSTQNKKSSDIEKVCFNLPTTVDTSVFGPEYWNAFHTLASKIPCGGCRGFAEKFMVFFHDLVNVKTGAKIYDQANYNYFLSAISKLNSGVDFKTAFGI